MLARLSNIANREGNREDCKERQIGANPLQTWHKPAQTRWFRLLIAALRQAPV